MAPTDTLSKSPSETTDLERRVLAHERVLQALIAYMSRTEPRFVDHLRVRFVEPMSVAVREHDYRDTNDYAEEFIRAIIRLGEIPAARSAKTESKGEAPRSPQEQGLQTRPFEQSGRLDRVQIKERGGIWEVKVDGAFHGDYREKEQAVAAMALVKLSLR